jgi:glucose-6-phosphate 1-dehydrogenase
VEAAWRIVDPILRNPPPLLEYDRGSWGPPEADALIVNNGSWIDPEEEPEPGSGPANRH